MHIGDQTIMDYPLADGPGLTTPLTIATCRNCGLAQTLQIVTRNLLYRRYYYRSRISGTMRRALESIASAACSQTNLLDGDWALDIGGNDGYLVEQYPPGIQTLVIDPVKNIESPTPRGMRIKDYFNYWLVPTPVRKKVKVITSIAMFYDVSNPRVFTQDVARLLHPEGVWVNQLNYLPAILRNSAVDYFSHEHLTHWRLVDINNVLADTKLEVFDVELLPLNGGTARFYIGRVGMHPVQDVVAKLRSEERSTDWRFQWECFARNTRENAQLLHQYVTGMVLEGKTVAVLGASTRGNALLQFSKLDARSLAFASDRDPNKWGRRMAGTNIPIISEEEARQRHPDAFLVLPYSYIDEIVLREEEYLAGGGCLAVPIPGLELYFKDRRIPYKSVWVG